MKPVVLVPEYSAFLTEVKGRIQAARLRAGRAVNRELVMLYWEIGRGILEKQAAVGWGESVVERLSADLRAEFPNMRGFSGRNIWDMRRFFETYSSESFLRQVVAEFSAEQRKGKFEGTLSASVATADSRLFQFYDSLSQKFLGVIIC